MNSASCKSLNPRIMTRCLVLFVTIERVLSRMLELDLLAMFVKDMCVGESRVAIEGDDGMSKKREQRPLHHSLVSLAHAAA